MNFKSVKLFGAMCILFIISGFLVSLQGTEVLPLTQIAGKFPKLKTLFKITLLVLGFTLTGISLQTLYCRGKSKLDTAIHLLAGLSLFTLLLSPTLWKSRIFYLYPYSYVKIDGKVVGLKELIVEKSEIYGKFFIKTGNNTVESRVSFNKPLISKEGFIWIKGISEVRGIPALQVEFSSFSIAPFTFLTLFGLSTILLSVRLLKEGGGRDVHSS